jgi:hypothetical protein
MGNSEQVKLAQAVETTQLCCAMRNYEMLGWCPGAESNHRHCDFQSHALPTELPGRATEGLKGPASGRFIVGPDHPVYSFPKWRRAAKHREISELAIVPVPAARNPIVMAGLVPPARPKPLRRGEGPAIHVLGAEGKQDVDARDERGHDENDKKRVCWTAP